MEKSCNYYLIKADRFFAWILFISMLLYFVSGYGMTKGIIDSNTAVLLHNDILPIAVLISFTAHTFFAIHCAFKRWNFWNTFSKLLLILLYVIFISGFLYFDLFYEKPKSEVSQVQKDKEIVEEDKAETNEEVAVPIQEVQKTFTLSQLAEFDGQNGQPAYLAVDGIVYDLSAVFKSGSHFSHIAGQDLTSDFYSKHAKEDIAKYPVVGTLVK